MERASGVRENKKGHALNPLGVRLFLAALSKANATCKAQTA
jgi:hypothetical protein